MFFDVSFFSVYRLNSIGSLEESEESGPLVIMNSFPLGPLLFPSIRESNWSNSKSLSSSSFNPHIFQSVPSEGALISGMEERFVNWKKSISGEGKDTLVTIGLKRTDHFPDPRGCREGREETTTPVFEGEDVGDLDNSTSFDFGTVNGGDELEEDDMEQSESEDQLEEEEGEDYLDYVPGLSLGSRDISNIEFPSEFVTNSSADSRNQSYVDSSNISRRGGGYRESSDLNHGTSPFPDSSSDMEMS